MHSPGIHPLWAIPGHDEGARFVLRLDSKATICFYAVIAREEVNLVLL
jgi:hypothetical protein